MKLITIELPNHDILKNPAETVKFPLDEKAEQAIQALTTSFAELESPYGKPAGLAGPQIGIPLRLFIIQIPLEAKKVRKNVFDTLPPTIFINPIYVPIVEEGKEKDWEGCYSVPNKMGEVYRYKTIHYEAYSITGEKMTALAKGFLARLIQHETGHLNGELYIDLIEPDCRFGSVDEMMPIRRKEMEG